MPNLMREDRLCSVDEEERGLASWLGGGSADGLQHGLELVVPAPAAGLQLLLEGSGLENPKDLHVCAVGLAVAPGVRHRSVAYLRSKVSTICFEEIAGELRTVVGDDTVRDPKPAHEALDELDCETGWDGADGFHLRPLGELVNGDVEVAVAPRRSREWAQDVQPPNREWPREWDGLEALSRLMDLLGVGLAGFAGLHQLGRVVERRGPVESAAECLADEGSRR